MGTVVTGDAGTTQVIAGATINAEGGNQLTLNGTPKDVKLTATLQDGTSVTGQWTTDDTRIGSVGTDGLFHANGYVGGTVNISLLVGKGQIKATLTANVDIVDNAAMIAPADQMALQAGGPSDPTFKFLYPYDGTIFPRGLAAPSLQFGDAMTIATTPAAGTNTYLKLTTSHFSYQAYALGTSPLRAGIPAAVWKGVTLTAGATDDVVVAVSKRTGTTVSGPLTEKWRIAQASLKGLIYYSTYNSVLTGTGANGGGILSIAPGGTAKIVQTGCVVCHSVSASGNVLTAASGPDLKIPTSSSSYNLSVTGTATARAAGATGTLLALAGLSPDGTKAVTNGVPGNVWPPQLPHGLRADAPAGFNSELVDTASGAVIPSPSLTAAVKWAQSPAFSPDGKKLTFINGDMWPARQLAVMDFDGASTFSGLKPLVTNTTELWSAAATTAYGGAQAQVLSWPSFTPDSAAVVYQQGDSFDSNVFNPSAFATTGAEYGEIRLTELDGTVNKLNALNGRDATGTTYLPYGEAVEGKMDYEPTMMPVAVGGYFWVVFTSRRVYGNTIAPGRKPTVIAGDDPTQDPWGSGAAPSQRKKLWVAAIDVDHGMKPDPSHPAFYLPGQEIESANMRAYAALAPCQRMGANCESGADCCDGYCRQNGNDATGAPILQCVPPPVNTCSNIDEPCMTNLDCCDMTNLCIAGRCAVPPPVDVVK
jgi:mono/diheme cytochrome c family protein